CGHVSSGSDKLFLCVQILKEFLIVTLATSNSNVKNFFRSAPSTSFSRRKLSYFRNPQAPTSMVTRSFSLSLSLSLSPSSSLVC
ncbi:MAG: hypothetical protein MJE68_33240, partial [Proteobacteria bacterium]|nr:hypothetical protein [Pseudomonadota bacterium]